MAWDTYLNIPELNQWVALCWACWGWVGCPKARNNASYRLVCSIATSDNAKRMVKHEFMVGG